jgi:K+-transporting ATPase ATPase B chain
MVTLTPAPSAPARLHITRQAVASVALDALRKFDPRILWYNPVLLLVWAGSVLTTIVAIAEPFAEAAPSSGGSVLPGGFAWMIAVWMWISLYAATVAESIAEGRGRVHTAALRSTREVTTAHKVRRYNPAQDAPARQAETRDVSSQDLRPGDIVVLTGGDIVPADGEVVWGIASVDESAITGESAPVIRESGGDRSGVTGGTRVLSDRIVVRVTAQRGATAVDRMIDLAEGAHRHKSPTEMALTALLASFSICFVIIAVTVNPIVAPVAPGVSVPVLVAVVATLIPTEVAALMSVTGIAAMYRLLQRNILVDSGHALDTAGEITTVLLDKTGTITAGNRRATSFTTVNGATAEELLRAAVLSSLDDPTPEGTSIIQLAQDKGYQGDVEADPAGRIVAFSAQTRLSGRDLPDGTSLRKGAESSVLTWLKHVGTQQPKPVTDQLRALTHDIALTGGTPLVVAIKPAGAPGRLLGVIHLTDVVKASVPARIGQLRSLGVRTVMITGDNPLTAQAIGQAVGVDESVGDATPEDKLALITDEQAQGHFVAMSGDGTNDAPALAQADVGVAMNSATAAAKKAANMVILDDDPTRLVEIIETGRRQQATRGALVTFNMANDIVRYCALFPALFAGTFPGLDALNILRLHSPASAVVSTLIYSTVVIICLIPLAMWGVPYRMSNLARALSRNLLYYGLGGIVFAAVWIKGIDLLIGLLPGY